MAALPNEAKAELKRLNNKVASLEKKNTELRIQNGAMKKAMSNYQKEMKGFDKKVDRVVEVVVKELRTLKAEIADPDDSLSSKDTPKKIKLEAGTSLLSSLTNTTTASSIVPPVRNTNTTRVQEPTTDSGRDTGLLANFAKGNEGIDAVIESRQGLLRMMKNFLDKSPYSK